MSCDIYLLCLKNGLASSGSICGFEAYEKQNLQFVGDHYGRLSFSLSLSLYFTLSNIHIHMTEIPSDTHKYIRMLASPTQHPHTEKSMHIYTCPPPLPSKHTHCEQVCGGDSHPHRTLFLWHGHQGVHLDHLNINGGKLHTHCRNIHR
jgi:hypothetical protein